MAYSRETYSFEAKVEHSTEKSRLIEMTLGGRYWLPKKCIDAQTQADPDGNCWFVVSEWWWNKRDDFDADKPRE